MVSNIGKITDLAGTPSKGLVDGTDKLHSGIIKVLESFSQDNMCVSHAGFTITDGGTYTQYNLAQPIKFRANGQYVSYTGGDLTVAYSSTVQDASNSRYDWVLLNPNIGGTPAIVIVQGTAGTTPLVSDITTGYIPIALVHISAGTDNDKFDYSFQTFTMNLSKNSISIGYNDSGYAEAMSIVATADRTTFKNKVANADIRFILADNTADEKFEILSDDDSDGDEGDTTVFSVDGLGATTVLGTLSVGTDLTVTGGDITYGNGQVATLGVTTSGSGTVGRDLTISAGSTTAASGNTDGGDLILKSGLADGTGSSFIAFHTSTATSDDAVTERMRIHTNGNVGIGTATPSELLHLSDADGTEPTILIENTGTDANEPELVFLRSTGTGADSRDIAHIKFKAKDTAGNTHTFVNLFADSEDADSGTEDGRLLFYVTKGGTDSVEQLRISGSSGIIFNEGGADIDVRIEGDTDANLLVTNAGSDKVGIGTNAPTQKLGVSGSIGSSSYHGSVVEITGSGLPTGGPPPAPVSLLNLNSDTHRTVIADTQASAPNPPNALSLILPAASGTHQGWEMRIICKNNAGGADDLTLDVTGASDLIVDAQGSTLGNASTGFSLATGKIYTVIHINTTMYMCILLN